MFFLFKKNKKKKRQAQFPLVAGSCRLAANKGFSLIDVLQPCVSFNRINTFGWFNQRCYEVGAEHDPEDRNAALRLAEEWVEKIPIGVIYTNHRPSFESHFPLLQRGPLASQPVRKEVLESLLHSYQ